MKSAYLDYTKGKQSLRQISSKYRKSIPTIRKYFDQHKPIIGEISSPQNPVAVTLDAFFWNRKSGVLVARADKKNLLWREIRNENLVEYRLLLRDLTAAKIHPTAFTIDGRRGVKQLLLKVFPRVPVQLCQFHAVATVTKYLTKNPKPEAGRQLRKIVLDLRNCGRLRFARKLKKWQRRWADFLAERVPDDLPRGWHYTHRRLRSAHRSLLTNLPYLFTFQKYPQLEIPNTTNSCDGYFAHLKQKIKLHRGLRAHRRKKMCDFLMENGLI